MTNFTSQQLTLYGNLKIERVEKLEMFMATFPAWMDYWGCNATLRVRGRFADDAIAFASSNTDVECLKGQDFEQWRWQTMNDVSQFMTPYVFQYLEDHLPSPTAPSAECVIQDLANQEIDILQYSWFQSYEKQLAFMRGIGAKEGYATIAIALNRRHLAHHANRDLLYFISLTSIFDRSFYLRLLKSPRPWIRKFDPRAPFDVEQKPPSAWLLPMTYACVKKELGICLDDDLLSPGSSAIARGLFSPSQLRSERIFEHHMHAGVRSMVNRWISEVDKLTADSAIHPLPVLARKILTFFDTLKYTVRAPIMRMIDKRTMRWKRL